MIKIGTCGFSFADWVGPVYPPKIKKADMLTYYNRELGLDTVEIDASYYTVMNRRVAESWVRKTTDDFTFAIKCHKDMTLNEIGKINPADLDNKSIFDVFLETFKPLKQSGKLLTYLAQFGPVFMKNRGNLDYILTFRERFGDLPLIVEFRHKSWLSEENAEDTFTFLEKNNLGYAIVDEPKLRALAPFVPKATNEIGYFRLHGRNKKWFGSDRDQRYNYFYSDEELSEFISPIQYISERTKITPVYFNNCHAGAAMVNALRLFKLLDLLPSRYEPEGSGQLEFPF